MVSPNTELPGYHGYIDQFLTVLLSRDLDGSFPHEVNSVMTFSFPFGEIRVFQIFLTGTLQLLLNWFLCFHFCLLTVHSFHLSHSEIFLFQFLSSELSFLRAKISSFFINIVSAVSQIKWYLENIFE